MTEEPKMYQRIRRQIAPGKYALYWIPESYVLLPDETAIERAELNAIGTKTTPAKPLPKYEAYADK